MGERCNRTAEVRSSILLGSTSLKKAAVESRTVDNPTMDGTSDAAFSLCLFGEVSNAVVLGAAASLPL